ncbi:MAG: iron export ABC transporter permease subunit FetB [Syntrophotaleaceae bacterium]
MNDKTIIDLDYLNLIFAYGLFLLAVGLGRLRRIGQTRDMIWASVRMLIQLFAVGYLLRWIFAVRHPLPTLLILLVMGGFALQVLGERIRNKVPAFYRVISISLFLGCGTVTYLFCLLVVTPTPWYDPRYLVPLAGMIIGNSMNGAGLAAERLSSEMRERREEIETALSLGAASRTASQTAVRNAFRAALLPTTNSMAAMGIVSLPGMMTGQILSGVDPLTAVKYQIAIMCAILGSVAVTSLLTLLLGYRFYFTPAHQLREW